VRVSIIGAVNLAREDISVWRQARGPREWSGKMELSSGRLAGKMFQGQRLIEVILDPSRFKELARLVDVRRFQGVA
jgi:hypothetical protein